MLLEWELEVVGELTDGTARRNNLRQTTSHMEAIIKSLFRYVIPIIALLLLAASLAQ
jgi:hypothetical protein